MSLSGSRINQVILLALAIATACVYAQVSGFEFVNADDQSYITENAQVQRGLGAESVAWAFTTREASNWHPLTWMSHMLDIDLFGMWAGGHHLTNVLLHVINTLILFALLLRMTSQRWPSAFVAALFALHPLHVESVAWVSERKDVLSTCFGLLAIGAYVEATARKSTLGLATLFMGLSLLSKPMFVTLPFVLLLLDYWPLGRLRPAWLPPVAEGKEARAPSLRTLLREKLPLFALTGASCALTFAAQQAGGAVKAAEVVAIPLRLANAAVAYVLYLWKMIWPVELAVLYPHPYVAGTGGEAWAMWQVAGSLLLVAGITLAVLGLFRRPYAIVGWFWYLGTLVPVIGIVQVGNQALADRYTYVPLIGIFVAVAFAAQELVESKRLPKAVVGVLAALALTGSTVLTVSQVAVWRDSLTLFEHALAIEPNNSIIHTAISASYNQQRKMDDAIAHSLRAIEIKPDYVEAHSNLANAWLSKGDPERAIVHYRDALAIDPENATVLYNLANALSRLGRFEEAIASYERALDLDPQRAASWHQLGNAQAELGSLDLAIRHYERALELDPTLSVSHYMLGRALAKQQRYDTAAGHYRQTLELDPNHTQARYYLGRALERQPH